MRRCFDPSRHFAVIFLKLSPSISEQTETIKSKKCTFSLHGPWGEHSTQTFIRVTFFNFPLSYPRPSSLSRKSRPSAEIEKGSSDLPKGQRRVLVRDLRKILAREAPALELCLLYLLGRYELPSEINAVPSNTWGDDDDDGALVPGVANENCLPVALLIDHHTLPRSRHTQAMFGPNGDYPKILRPHSFSCPCLKVNLSCYHVRRSKLWCRLLAQYHLRARSISQKLFHQPVGHCLMPCGPSPSFRRMQLTSNETTLT